MIRSLIILAARHKYLVVLLCAAAVALAVRSMREIPLDAIPDLSDTQIIVYSR